MKAVLISINPIWCDLIAAGKKTIEVRKTRPNLEVPFKVYIYCTQDKKGVFANHNNWRGNGMVIGEFICDKIQPFDVPYPAFQGEIDKDILERSCLTYWQLHRYAYHDYLYLWHISNLKIYDRPKKICDFHKPCEDVVNCWNRAFREAGKCLDKCFDCGIRMKRPPQSWCYVEECSP